MTRLASRVTSAAAAGRSSDETSVSVAISHQGLKALGLSTTLLEGFAWEFRQGMAARAGALGDVGDSAPKHWEPPLGTSAAHVVRVGVAREAGALETAIARAHEALADLPGVTAIWRQDCRAPADEREPFGYRDGISHPAIEGSGVPGTNGAYVAFRKLHQDVAAFRRYLRASASGPADEEHLAAKMMGRWRSGAPLALCPLHDDPDLGADASRNNAFGYRDDDAIGYKTPAGSHVRRANPRDAAVAGVARLHRMVRRGAAYGPALPEGVLEDDGADRGLMFAFVGAHLGRQFEFVQSEWINSGEFLGLGDAKDPIVGPGAGAYSIPQRPAPRRLRGLARFVVTRGGEYAFLPGLSALRWLGSAEAYRSAGPAA